MKQHHPGWISRSVFFILSAIGLAGPYHPAIEYVFPLPESKFLMPRTTVILRLEADHRSAVTDLASLIRVTAHSVNPSSVATVQGEIFWSTDKKTVIFKPNAPFETGDTIQVQVRLNPMGLDDFNYQFHVADEGVHLLKNSETPDDHCQAVAELTVAPRIVHGVALPSDFPEIRVKKHGETAPGYLTFGAGNYLIMLRHDGTPYFYRRVNAVKNVLLHHTDAHPDGLMSYHINAGQGYYILNHHFEVIANVHAGHGYTTDNHELQILPDGHIVIIGQQNVKMDVSGIIPGGRKDATVLARCFQELDLDHNVVFEWRSLDHCEIAAADDGTDLKGSHIDPSHMNSVERDADGHFILSSKTQNEITKISRRTGEVIWRFSGPNNQFRVLNDPHDPPANWQHDARHVPGHDGEYIYFDNRNYGKNVNDLPAEAFSRVVRYKLNTEEMTAELLWSYRHTPDIYCYGKCAAQLLSNGNYYIDWTNKRKQDGKTQDGIYGTEVTSEGALVFEISLSHGTYRTRHYDWDAFLLKPELIIENDGKIVRLIYNQFGAEEIVSYNVYYGTSVHPSNMLIHTENPWVDFSATAFRSGTTYYFGVRSVNQDGEESDMSNVESTSVNYTNPDGNMVFNGDFSQAFDFWEWHQDAGVNAEKTITAAGELHVQISEGGTAYEQLQVRYPNLALVAGRTYLFEFDAYAENNRLIQAEVRQSRTPHAAYSNVGTTSLRRQKQRFSYEFNMQNISDSRARIVLDLGSSDADVHIDNVSLKQVTSHVTEDETMHPETFRLFRNYPNPFNPLTAIHYQLSASGRVRLEVVGATGRRVAQLIDENQGAGQHEVLWNAVDDSGRPLPSGVYFARLRWSGATHGRHAVHKMVLIQ